MQPPSQETTTGNMSYSDSEDLINCFSIIVCPSLLTVYALVLFNFAAMPGCPVRHGLSC